MAKFKRSTFIKIDEFKDAFRAYLSNDEIYSIIDHLKRLENVLQIFFKMGINDEKVFNELLDNWNWHDLINEYKVSTDSWYCTINFKVKGAIPFYILTFIDKDQVSD